MTRSADVLVIGLSVIAIDRKKVIGEPVQCAEFIPLPLARRDVAIVKRQLHGEDVRSGG